MVHNKGPKGRVCCSIQSMALLLVENWLRSWVLLVRFSFHFRLVWCGVVSCVCNRVYVGSGKTTFMHALIGRVALSAGTVMVSSSSVEGKGESSSAPVPIKKCRKIIGFVAQEDTMLRELTVRDVLTDSAFARLPSSMSRTEKLQRVGMCTFTLLAYVFQ